MNRFYMMMSVLSMLALLSPWQVSEATPNRANQQLAYQLLQAGDSEVVRSLPQGEREILLAVIAMNQGQAKKAISLLSVEAVHKDRLAALIRAEAYRRQSVQAAERAGHYAHAANADIGRLKQARISTGLDEANQRLRTFMVSLNVSQQAVPEQLVLQSDVLTSAESTLQQPAIVTSTSTGLQEVKLTSVTTWPSIVGRPARMVASNASNASNASKQPKVKTNKRSLSAVKPMKTVETVKVVQRKATRPVAPVATGTSKLIKSVHESLAMWRKDWASRDSGAYLSHYHKAFKTAKHDYKSWVTYKRRVNAKKSYIRVKLSHVKISRSSKFKQWGETVRVSFKQRYQSSNYNANSRKTLYMTRARAGDPWLILREE